MTALKKNIKPFLKTKRLNVFLLFVILALIFSVLSKLSNTYTRTFKFSIDPINVPEDHVIIKDSTLAMEITLTTHGFKHAKYYLSTPKIVIDFSELDKNTTHYSWIELNNLPDIRRQFDASVKVENTYPDTIAFRYDVNAVKRVPITLKSEITFLSGFDLSEPFVLTPDSIKIIGPKIIIDSISSLETRPLVLANVSTDISQELQIDVPNPETGITLGSTGVNVTGKVEKFTEGAIEVPITVANAPENINVNFYPKTVAVTYYTSLSQYNNITASSFIVECDYNTLISGNNYMVPKIVKYPDYVKSVKLNIRQVEFIVSQ